MFRTSPIVIAVISIAPFACTGANSGGEDTKTTGETSGSGTALTSEGTASTNAVSTSLPTTSETANGDTTQADTGEGLSATTTEGGTTEDSTTEDSTTRGSTTEDSTGHSTTGHSSTDASTETDGESPFKVGLALKTLCTPNFDVMCGVTPDDRMVCWGDVEHASFKVPPGKVKGVSDHCFLAILDNGELHRVMDFPSEPVSLPKGPFVLSGGNYPYGCAMAANNEMACWVAEGYQALEEPPPGPYLALGEALESNCQMCGIKGNGSLVCWKKPINGDWDYHCGAEDWSGVAAGTYTKFMGSGFEFVTAMNSLGQFVWFMPNAGGSTYVEPLFAPGGFVEANGLVGLKDSGQLLYFEKAMGDGVPVLPGGYMTFEGTQYNGCAIRQADSRVVCWGQGDFGQFDPPTE